MDHFGPQTATSPVHTGGAANNASAILECSLSRFTPTDVQLYVRELAKLTPAQPVEQICNLLLQGVRGLADLVATVCADFFSFRSFYFFSILLTSLV